jgi:hypothetical protein
LAADEGAVGMHRLLAAVRGVAPVRGASLLEAQLAAA